jgi:hypothetical protein
VSREIEERTWRNRFIALQLLRIGGTLLVLFALLLWQTDMIVTGGLPIIGFALALAGLVISFFAPRELAKIWRRQDGR